MMQDVTVKRLSPQRGEDRTSLRAEINGNGGSYLPSYGENVPEALGKLVESNLDSFGIRLNLK